MSATAMRGDDLPRVVPIFPLPGVLLMPRGKLPLNMFEPRYLEMTRDAMAGARMIGMVQPLSPEARGGAPKVYPTGCLGCISAFRETPDGRFLVTLTGMTRFTIVDELDSGKLYRTVRVSYDGYGGDLEAERVCKVDRNRLIPALKTYFADHGITADWEAIQGAPDDSLVTTLAMVCPLAPNEKQALLECPDLCACSDLLASLIEMANLERGRCRTAH